MNRPLPQCKGHQHMQHFHHLIFLGINICINIVIFPIQVLFIQLSHTGHGLRLDGFILVKMLMIQLCPIG